jgi:Fe-Mn family superoxide dismutase
VVQAVRNHGGGYVNHNMFWHVMTPGGPDAPQGDLAVAINHHFGSLVPSAL